MTRPVSTVAAAVWTLLVIVSLLLPGSSVPESHLLQFDKVVHAFLFGVGVFLWLRVPWGSRRVRWAIILAALVLAPASEIFQQALGNGRSADPMDALADIVGIVLGSALWLLLRRRRNATIRRSVR
ncbi:MAG: VanZ family protein [Rhodothermales bacterium]|nr:VanZ family protein [Rhodothermales bacterium]